MRKLLAHQNALSRPPLSRQTPQELGWRLRKLKGSTKVKRLVIGLICSMGLIAAAVAASQSDLTAPIHQFIDSFNKGDAAAAESAYLSTGSTIIDEVPPHLWQGPGAFKAWVKDLETHDTNEGMTDQQVILGKVIRTESTIDKAYVVIAATYAFNQKGVEMREPSQMTYVLQKEAGDWKIAAWTWTGPKPKKRLAPPL
jgi:hypothetical protein